MARRIDPDNDNEVRDAVAQFRTIVHETRGRGKVLILEIREEDKEPAYTSPSEFPLDIDRIF